MGAFLVMLLAFVGMEAGAAAAVAASGSLHSVDLKVVADGFVLPNVVDDSSNNGVVATNDAVEFRWDLKVTDLIGGEFTQTLPEGWTWDQASLAALDTNGDVYQASHTVTDGGRTLTGKITVGKGGGVVLLSVDGMKAIPGRSVADGATYTPTLDAKDGSGVKTASADALTVRSVASLNFSNSTPENNVATAHDFGDGKGKVSAHATVFRIAIAPWPATSVGYRDLKINQPVTVTHELTLPAAFKNLPVQAELFRASQPNATPSVSSTGNTTTVTLGGFENFPAEQVWVDLAYWVRDSDLPSDGTKVDVTSTANPGGWKTTDGQTVDISDKQREAIGHFALPSDVVTPLRAGYGLLVQKDPSDSGAVSGDPIAGVWTGRFVLGARDIAPGSIVVGRTWVIPGVNEATGAVSQVKDLVAYDFWDSAHQRMMPGAGLYVGWSQSTSALPSSEYAVQYTSGTDRANPEANTWVDSVALAGGREAVSGVRISYTKGNWPGVSTTDSERGSFVIGVPRQVIAPALTEVKSTGRWSLVDENGDTPEPRADNVVYTSAASLWIGKEASKTSVVGGDKVTFTLNPIVGAQAGMLEGDINGVKIVDQLPEGLTAVDTSQVHADWKVTREGTLQDGLKLTFTYAGKVTTATELPKVTYAVKMPLYAAPGRQFVNRATMTAEGAWEGAAVSAVTYIRPQVVASEKTTVGLDEIQVGDKTVAWESRWYNFQTDAQGQSYFVDVLPFNGDNRGTKFSGTATLASALVTNGQGAAAAPGGHTLQYTTAAAGTVLTTEANDNSVAWVDADGVDLAKVPGITALRVIVKDFVSGDAGNGGLLVSMNVDGQKAGDSYVNSTKGWLGRSGRLGVTNKSNIDVRGGSISGVLWDDADSSGTHEASEQLLPNAKVMLQDKNGAQVAAARTNADGSYRFSDLRAGDYQVTTDMGSLGYPATSVVAVTFDRGGKKGNTSGIVALTKAEDVSGIDFGYRALASSVTLNQTGSLDGSAAEGSTVTWEFVITNSGEAPLSSVALTDHLAGTSAPAISWPGKVGELAPGAKATAQVTSTLTQQDLDRGSIRNTATVSGKNTSGIAVSADADALVTLPEGAALKLETTGSLSEDAVAGTKTQWEYLLTNTGNVTLTDIQLQDALTGKPEFVAKRWPGAEGTLKPGQSVRALAYYELTQKDVDRGNVRNDATATGITPAKAGTDSNQASDTLALTTKSALSVEALLNGESYSAKPGAALTAGDEAEWSYTVTNRGATTLSEVTLSDNQVGALAAPADFTGTLAPGEMVVFTQKSSAQAGVHRHVGTATALTPQKQGVSATDETWYTASTKSQPPAGGLLATTGGQIALGTIALAVLLISAGVALTLRKRRQHA